MQMSLRKLLIVTLLGISTGAVWVAGWAAQQPAGQGVEPAASPTPLWPRQFQAAGAAFTVYPPQLERWEGDRLEGRAAVAVEAAGTTDGMTVAQALRSGTFHVFGLEARFHDNGNVQGPLGESGLWLWHDRKAVPVPPDLSARSEALAPK